jgi:GNAT superfamily N-acetyltransferase
MALLDLAEIARLEERRQAVGVAEVADEAEPIAGGTMCFAGLGSWANQAMGLAMGEGTGAPDDGAVDDAELDRLTAFYESRGAEPRIEVCPFAHPSLIDGLARRGFTLKEFVGVLARDLRSLDLPVIHVPGLEIVRLEPDDPEHARACLEIKVAGFGVEDRAMFERLERRIWSHPGCLTLLGKIDREFVAAGSLEVRAPAGALIGMSTLEGYRKRGVQQAMTIARLERLSERGCAFACVQSSPMVATGRNALRLGFHPAYTKAVLTRPGEGLAPSP